jgi:hypothetical protein
METSPTPWKHHHWHANCFDISAKDTRGDLKKTRASLPVVDRVENRQRRLSGSRTKEAPFFTFTIPRNFKRGEKKWITKKNGF